MREAAAARHTPDSYREILHSTALIGASTVIAMFFSLIRAKTLAVLLGTGGVGLVALFSSIADVVVALAGMGLSQSGVRQIAQAEGSGDRQRVAGTMRVLTRTSLVLGLAGGLGLAVLGVPAALLTFGTTEYSVAVAALGLLVLLRIMTGGQTALLQGARRVGDLARLNIGAALASVVVTVPLVLVWGALAIVPALILTGLATWVIAQCFVRRVVVAGEGGGKVAVGTEVRELLRLGFAFMISGLLTMGAAYAIRILVLHAAGVDAAGLYQAGWALAGLYVGVVLQAMGTDFYPRLTAVVHDNAAVTRLVNEQTQVSMLLAGPGILATITFAPLLLIGFYSTEFAAASGLLRWLCVGMMLRVVSWPMGYIIVAKGWQRTFIAVEIGATAIHVGGAALLLPYFGVEGAGLAYASLYVCHAVAVYLIARRRCGFRLSGSNEKLLLLFGGAAALAVAGFLVLPFWWAFAVGTLATAGTGLLALHRLGRILLALFVPAELPGWLGGVVRRASADRR